MASFLGLAMYGKEFEFYKWKRTINNNKTYMFHGLKYIRQCANHLINVISFNLHENHVR